MKVLSLFDGISCGMLALQRAGIPVECYDAFEIDKYAVTVSKRNFPVIVHHGNVYDGDLGIALSDTYTSGIFLSNLSRKQAKLFDGVRCDSGNEFEFIDRLVARYKELGIDATTKTIVFSNALDFTKALDIQEYCKNKIRCSFGIGTNLTNDTGFEPSNIVMKLTQCKMNVNQEWRECIKLSDDEGKHTGSLEEVQACLHELRLN